MKTPQADGLPTPTVSCSRNELCQKRLDWPPQPSLLGLVVPLLLPHLAAQSGIARQVSKGMNPGASGMLTLPLSAWFSVEASLSSLAWRREGRVGSELESGVEVGRDPNSTCTPMAEECRTSETQE